MSRRVAFSASLGVDKVEIYVFAICLGVGELLNSSGIGDVSVYVFMFGFVCAPDDFLT
jgi:hypothetical protein